MADYQTLIASHRGGAFLWPENSLAAFRETAELRLEQVECDVHVTADGDVVVIHDATLDRTTDGRGAVALQPTVAVTQSRIRGCGAERVPMLSDMLGVFQGTSIALRIEIKSDAQGRPYPRVVAKVLEELDQVNMRKEAWIIAFDAGTVAEVAAAGGVAGVAWLLEGATWQSLGVRGVVAVARDYGFPEIGVHESVLDAASCEALRGAGLRVSVWGANHEASIRRMLALSVDVLTTDDPPLAIALRG